MIPLFKVNMSPLAAKKAQETLMSGWVGQGPAVEEFEGRLNVWLSPCGIVPVTVSSGTMALQIALALAGVRRGDYVVSTPMTCTATNAAILNRGGRILWADVDPETGLISPESVQDLCHEFPVRAVVAVDWGGRSCDYDALNSIHPFVIGDMAHRFGALAEHPFPRVACWSFQAIKFLTTVDGGALSFSTGDEPLRDRAVRLRWYGLERSGRAWDQAPEEHGYKGHMNDLAASIGLANIPIAARARRLSMENAGILHRALEGVVKPGEFDLPPYSPEADYWMFSVLVDDQERFINHMARYGVGASPVHTRNDVMPAYRAHPRGDWALPGVAEFSRRHVAIPCGPWVSFNDRLQILDAIERYVRSI